MKLKNLVKSLQVFSKVSLSLIIARILSAIITFITAKYLGSKNYALFSTGFFLMTIVGFSGTGLDKSFVFNYVRRKEKRDMLNNYLIAKGFFFIIILFISVVFVNFYFAHSYLKMSAFWGILFSSSFFLFTTIISIFQAKTNYSKYSLFFFLFYLIATIFIVLGFFCKISSYVYYLASYMISSIFLVMLSLNKFFIPTLKKETMFSLLHHAKWLLLSEFLWLIFIRMDYFTISKFVGLSVLGNYGLSLKLVNIFFTFVSSFSIILLPKAAALKTKRDLETFWRYNYFIFAFLFIIGILLILTGPFFIKLIFGKEFFKATDYFVKLLIAYLPTIFLPPLQYILLTLKKEVHYFISYFILPIFYLLLFVILKNLGINGVIISKGCAFISSVLFSLFVYIKYKKHLPSESIS